MFPAQIKQTKIVFDGFSPNLNKDLHVGHLKNLCIAAALTNITAASPVAMLGATNGIKPGALEAYKQWCEFAEYQPGQFLDIELPPPNIILTDGVGEYVGCKMFGDVVVFRSNGTPTYAAHDLSFKEIVSPDFYLTGAEQHPHFVSLGLGDRHIPMGLVLGKDSKKMKSTLKLEGQMANVMMAQELVEEIMKHLKPTIHPMDLIWNVLAWQFNSASVGTDTVLDVETWCNITSPGIYITYTNARINKALKEACGEAGQMTQEDVELCGMASYFFYYWQRAIEDKEPCHVAQFALKLAKKLSEIYGKKSIKSGEAGFVYSLRYTVDTLQRCMSLLGMKILEEV